MIKKTWNKLFRKMESWARVVVLPGFEGVPLYDALKFFVRGLGQGALTSRASALSFNFFLALFPSIIFLFTLIPYIPIENFQEQLMKILQDIMPASAFDATQETLEDIIKKPHSGLLSVGFLSALFFSTNGFNSMIDGFNASSHQLETRSLLRQRLVALFLVFVQTLVIVFAIGLLIFTQIIISKISDFGLQEFHSYLIMIGRWVIIFVLFFVLISFTYYLGPSSVHKWKFITAGSTFATFMIIVTSLVFAFYVNNFGQYNKLYGSIGTLIVVLLWIYFNSIILLLGFELNASIHTAKKGKKPIIDIEPAAGQ